MLHYPTKWNRPNAHKTIEQPIQFVGESTEKKTKCS